MFEEVKINRVGEAKLDSSIHSSFGALLCVRRSGGLEKWALCADQSLQQGLQF